MNENPCDVLHCFAESASYNLIYYIYNTLYIYGTPPKCLPFFVFNLQFILIYWVGSNNDGP